MLLCIATPVARRVSRTCAGAIGPGPPGMRLSSSGRSGAALLRCAQWQGEGGGNASGILVGCGVAGEVLQSLLPREVQRLETPVEKPRPRSKTRPANGVWWHGDLTQQLNATWSTLDRGQPSMIFSAGGDCSADMGPCSWLLQRYGGDLAVLYLDAHADLNSAEESPSGHFHGMWLRALLGDAPFDLAPRWPLPPDQLVYAGLRELDPPEAAAVQRLGIAAMSPTALTTVGGGSALRSLLQATGCKRLHIHLDLDVLDPEVFPHVSVPSPGGLTVGELQLVLREAADCLPLVGLTVTELKIDDPSDAQYCAEVIRDLLGPGGVDLAIRACAS